MDDNLARELHRIERSCFDIILRVDRLKDARKYKRYSRDLRVMRQRTSNVIDRTYLIIKKSKKARGGE